MNDQANLRDKLLRADGIDPAGASETDIVRFGRLLDRARHARPLWKRIMRNPIARLGAAAALVVVALLGLYSFLGGANHVWAQVLDKVRSTNSYQCRITRERVKATAQGEREVTRTENITYVSEEYGLLIEVHVADEVVYKSYVLFDSQQAVSIDHVNRTCTRSRADERREDFAEKFDPRQWVVKVLEGEYSQLSPKIVNGRTLAGIESRDSSVLFGSPNAFDEFVHRLWIDLQTKLPVQAETEYAYAMEGVTIRDRSVIDEFRWNPEFPVGFFTVDVPDDYTLWTDRRDETACVNSLRSFARATGGKYPSTLELGSFWDEMRDIKEFKHVNNVRQMASGEYRHDRIDDALWFREMLVEKGYDVAYYGSSVTPADTDAVLMHWDVSETERRVIWGDLRIETISAAKLKEAIAETERPLGQDDSEGGLLVEGRLVYANGRPVRRGRVCIGQSTAFSDTAGYFATKIPAGDSQECYLGHASGPNGQTGRVFFFRPKQAEKRLSLVLDFLCTVRVQVVGADGSLLRQAAVKLAAHPGGTEDGVRVLSNRARIDGQGYFVFDDVPVGLPLELFVRAPDLLGDEKRVPIGELVPDQRIDMADIVFSGAPEARLNHER